MCAFICVPLFVWVGITLLPLYSLASVLCTCISMYIHILPCTERYRGLVLLVSVANNVSCMCQSTSILSAFIHDCVYTHALPITYLYVFPKHVEFTF